MCGVGWIALMLVVCAYEANAVDTNYTVTIKDNAEEIEFNEGGDVSIKCEVVFEEEEMKRYLTVKWFHQGNELVDLPREHRVFGGHGRESNEDIFNTFEGSGLYGEEEDCSENKLVLSDNSLKISVMKVDDIGDYRCKAFISTFRDGTIELKAYSQVTTIYQSVPFPWWIIVVIVIIVVSVLFFLKYKNGWNIKGYYDVKDIQNTGAWSHKSDIYYKDEKITSDVKVKYVHQESALMGESV